MRKTVSRFLLTAFALLAMMGGLIYKLSTLTLAQGEVLTEEAEGKYTREIAVKGSRGRILDRNGIVLAYSKTSYNVEFLRDADNRTTYDSAVYTEALLSAIGIIERNGGKVIDTSYIRRNEAGEYVYQWGVTSEEAVKWRYKNFLDAVNVKIINYLSSKGITVPADYLKSENSANWDISQWPPAEYVYNYLRASWCIPEDISYEDALKVISIRQEVNLNNYRAYEPIVIAYDVSLETVSEISMRAAELVGVQTSQSTTRIYPRGESAAHIVGYLSRSATEGMVKDEGYSYNDYVGASGLEATMEQYLTGATYAHQGKRTVVINKNGSVVRELSYVPPSNGSDVVSTVDIQFQGVVETAIKNLIDTINQNEQDRIANPVFSGGSNGYLAKTDGDTSKIHTAQTGAIVVVDVNTGDVLAMASYPSFDPNWFIQGLSEEQSELLFNSDWAHETTPMRNKAISAKLAPGSIFKMVTGIAGLSEGVVGLDEKIDDLSPYRMYNEDHTEYTTTGMPSCWTTHPANHHDQDIVKAIQNSCNYYFCEVANRLGITRLNAWAGKFGLTSATGVELTGEAVGIIGGQDVLYNSALSLDEQKAGLSTLIFRKLVELLKELLAYYPTDATEEDVNACALHLMQLLAGGSLENTGPQVRRILSDDISIPEGYTAANRRWGNEITSLLNELQWKPALTIRCGFGQGTTLVTPVAVARYIAAVANEGTVYDLHIVDRILDENGALVKEIEPSVYDKIEIDSAIWDAIHKGMHNVVSADSPEDTGTAADKFSAEFIDSGYLDMISGKTGSAQIGNNVKIDIENTSWFVTYGPRDNPEIAVVVCVPYGLSGASSVPAVEDIFTYYFDKEKSVAPENLVDIGSIVP